MIQKPFQAANILLPDLEDYENFSVVACDQYSSQPEYWEEVEKQLQDRTSALSFILPEAWIGTPKGAAHQQGISARMEKALNESFFKVHPDCYIFVRRTLNDDTVRQGLIGMLDLETYDFNAGSKSAIRATEATILERIPPRVNIRKQAPLELPHILLLADDDKDELLSSINQKAINGQLPLLYDFDLMQNGGHISGYLIDQDDASEFDLTLEKYVQSISSKYPGLNEDSLVFAVGDGNHSLAAAKTIWEEVKQNLSEEEQINHPARFALAELENIHHDSQVFEPIHRIITETSPDELLEVLKKDYALFSDSRNDEANPAGFPVECIIGDHIEMIWLDSSKGELAIAILQNFLDQYLNDHPGKIDYIHGNSEVRALAQQDHAIGFILPGMNKSSLFRGVIADGSLPRKTFSMGHANEKRFYLEGKIIR